MCSVQLLITAWNYHGSNSGRLCQLLLVSVMGLVLVMLILLLLALLVLLFLLLHIINLPMWRLHLPTCPPSKVLHNKRICTNCKSKPSEWGKEDRENCVHIKLHVTARMWGDQFHHPFPSPQKHIIQNIKQSSWNHVTQFYPIKQMHGINIVLLTTE